MNKTLFISAFCFLLSAASHAATTYITDSASRADVQAKIDLTSDGDTVAITNGSAAWTDGITTTKQIIIKALNHTSSWGATNSTWNVNITNNSSNPLFQFTSGNTAHCGLEGIRFIEGSGSANHVRFNGSGNKVPKLLDCYFQVKQRNGTSTDVAVTAFLSLGGINKNCRWTSEGFTGAAGPSQGTDGACIIIFSPRAWETASTMGTNDVGGVVNIYFEDCSFYHTGQGPDTDDGGRVVIRHCILDGSWGLTHGFSSLKGGRHFEYYDNIFKNTYNTGLYRNMANRYFWIRAGTGLFTDNECNNAVNTSEWGNLNQVDIGDTSGLGTYPVDRQPGFGHNGSAHVSDPIYIWNQTGARAYTYIISNGWEDNVQLDRDLFVNNGAKPSYTKFTYPHTLWGGGDTTDPTVAISTPTSSSTYSTPNAALTVSGTASDDTAVTSVTWANDRGGSGSATGTTSWSVANLPLFAGVNVITITAADAAANDATDVITVTRTPAVGTITSLNVIGTLRVKP